MSLFVFFISLLVVAQHVSGNHMPIIRSWRLRDVIASCWYVPWLREGCQVRLVGSASYGRNKEYKMWHLVGFSYPHCLLARSTASKVETAIHTQYCSKYYCCLPYAVYCWDRAGQFGRLSAFVVRCWICGTPIKWRLGSKKAKKT